MHFGGVSDLFISIQIVLEVTVRSLHCFFVRLSVNIWDRYTKCYVELSCSVCMKRLSEVTNMAVVRNLVCNGQN
jgi:hypothetical protein